MSSEEKIVDYDIIGRDAVVLDYDKIGAGVDPQFLKNKTTPEQQKAIDEARRKFLEKGERSQLKREEDSAKSESERRETKPYKEEQTKRILEEQKKDKEKSEEGQKGVRPEFKEKERPDLPGSVMQSLKDITHNTRWIEIDVYFRSPFSHGHEFIADAFKELKEEQPDLTYDDFKQDFHWDRYEITIDRMPRKKNHIEYKFIKKGLKNVYNTDKNLLLEEPYEETLKVNGKSVAETEDTFQMIHDWVRKHVLPDGLIPKGAFSKEFHNLEFSPASSQTEATKDKPYRPMSYPGTEHFKTMHHRVFKEDAPHKEWESQKETFKALKKLGPLDRLKGHEEIMKKMKENLVAIDNLFADIKKQDKELFDLKIERGGKKEDWEDLQNEINQGKLIMPKAEGDKPELESLTDAEKKVRTEKIKTLKEEAENLDEKIKDLEAKIKVEKDKTDEKRKIFEKENEALVEQIKRDSGKAIVQKEFMRNKLKDFYESHPDKDKITPLVYVASFPEPFILTTAAEKGRVPFLKPDESDAKVKRLFELFDKYDIKSNPNPRGWLTPTNLKVLASFLRSMILAHQEKEIKGLGMSKKDLKKKEDAGEPKELKRKDKDNIADIEKAHQDELEMAIRAFPAFIKDLKDRAKRYQTSNALDYTTLPSSGWLEDEQVYTKTETEVARLLTEKPKDKLKPIQESGLERGEFKQLFAFVSAMIRGFKGMGQRLKSSPVETGSDQSIVQKHEEMKKIIEDTIQERKNIETKLKKLISEKSTYEALLTPKELEDLRSWEIEDAKYDSYIIDLEKNVKTPKSPGQLRKDIEIDFDTVTSRLHAGYIIQHMYIDLANNYDTRLGNLKAQAESETDKVKKQKLEKAYKIMSFSDEPKKKVRETASMLRADLARLESIKKDLKRSDISDKGVDEDAGKKKTNTELKEDIEKMISGHDTVKAEIDALVKEAESRKESTEEMAELRIVQGELAILDKELKDINSALKMYYPSSPATNIINSLKPFLNYFSRLYGFLTKTITFKEKYLQYERKWASEQADYEEIDSSMEVEAKEKTREEHLDKMTDLKDGIAQDAIDLARLDIHGKDQEREIKAAIGSMKSAITQYMNIFYLPEVRPGLTSRSAANAGKDEEELALEKKIRDMEEDLAVAQGAGPKAKLEAELKDLRHELRSKQLVRFRIPESRLHDAKKVIEKMKDNPNKKVNESAPAAQKEFDDLVATVTKAFNKGFTGAQVKEYAKEKGISHHKAGEALLKHQDALVQAAVEDFIARWEDFEKYTDDKTKEPKDHNVKEDSRLGQAVKHVFPELFKQTAPMKVFDIPKPAIPTPDDIIDMIEKTWGSSGSQTGQRPEPKFDKEKKVEKEEIDKAKEEGDELTHDELVKRYRDEMAEQMGGGGGGGGAKGRKREKLIRPNPPSYAGDLVKNIAVESYKKGMDGGDIINDALTEWLFPMKKQLEKAQDQNPDAYMDPQDVLNEARTAITSMYGKWSGTGLLSLKVYPSTTSFKNPPRGVNWARTPDIAIDSYAEAMEFDRIWKDMITRLNWYLETSKFSIPKLKFITPSEFNKHLKNIDEKWYPYDFIGAASEWMKAEKLEPGRQRDIPHPNKIGPMPGKPIEETSQPGKEEGQWEKEKVRKEQTEKDLAKRYDTFEEKYEKDHKKDRDLRPGLVEELKKKFRQRNPGLDVPKMAPKETPEEAKKKLIEKEFRNRKIPGPEGKYYEEEKFQRNKAPGFIPAKGLPGESRGEWRSATDLIDYPTQMSANIAAKFIGTDLPQDEIDAVLS